MTRPRPVTQADHDRVRELHAKGLSRNAIAEDTGRSGRTISRIADKLGLTFDRERTRAATEAKKEDARSKRAALALRLLDDAERLRQQLWKPAEYVDHGGKEFDEARWTMPEPTFADKAKIMQSVGIAVDRAVKLDEYDADQGAAGARSMLGDLGRALGAAAEALAAGEQLPPEDG